MCCARLLCNIFIQINFGFCKGDDNFGGRKRKELDDFLKSLGKSMNLVMYRMQDTERVRTKLREDRRQALRTKAEREEEREKMQMERLERNRKWREKMRTMSTLWVYRKFKERIKEEKFYDNSWASEILFRARSNTLVLEDLKRHSNEDTRCKICDIGEREPLPLRN